MTEADLIDWLGLNAPVNQWGYLAERALPDGRWAGVHPLTEGRARLLVGEPPPIGGIDDQW